MEIWNRSHIELPEYNSFTSLSNKSNSTGRQSGRIAFFFKSKFQQYITIMQNSCTILWCKLSKEVAGYEKDAYICALYIPPQNSPHFHTEIFEELENSIINHSSKGHILLPERRPSTSIIHGHMFTTDGLKPSPDKIKAAQQCQPPRSREELVSFIQIIAYLSRYINIFSSHCEPLRRLTRNKVKFE